MTETRDSLDSIIVSKDSTIEEVEELIEEYAFKAYQYGLAEDSIREMIHQIVKRTIRDGYLWRN